MVKLNINNLEVSFNELASIDKIIILKTPAPVENYKYNDFRNLLSSIKLLCNAKEVIAVPKHVKIAYAAIEDDNIVELSLNITDDSRKAED